MMMLDSRCRCLLLLLFFVCFVLFLLAVFVPAYVLCVAFSRIRWLLLAAIALRHFGRGQSDRMNMNAQALLA